MAFVILGIFFYIFGMNIFFNGTMDRKILHSNLPIFFFPLHFLVFEKDIFWFSLGALDTQVSRYNILPPFFLYITLTFIDNKSGYVFKYLKIKFGKYLVN